MSLTESPILTQCGAEQNRIHRAMAVNTGNDALLLRAHLFLCAKSSISIQTFIWKNDECGRYNAFLALRAARRGLKIRILVDCWPGLEYPPLLVFLGSAHPNIEVKFYNPPANHISPSMAEVVGQALTDITRLNHRMHNKTFIADEKVLILGGRNYENTYYDRGAGRNFKDREIAIAGPVVREACDSFEQYWNSSHAFHGHQLKDHAEELGKALYTVDSPREAFKLGLLFDELDMQCGDNKVMSSRFADKFMEVRHAEFIADPPGRAGAGASTSLVKLGELLKEGRRSVLLQSPYFVLDEFFREVFDVISSRRPAVDICLSTNSLAATDNVLAYATSLRDREKYLHLFPVRIFELRPLPADWEKILGYLRVRKEDVLAAKTTQTLTGEPGFHICIHAKTYVVDDDATCITSANIDPRSASVNSEAGIIVRDPEFTALVRQDVERIISPQNSWTIGVLPAADAESSLFSGLFDSGNSTLTACFEPIENGRVTAYYDPDFLKNYRSVGRFPQVEGSLRQIKALLLSVLSPAFRPYV